MARGIWVWLVFCLWGGSVAAAPCIDAARQAAHVHDVPPDILIAITLTETGRGRGDSLEAWPWAVNAFGAGEWHATRASARAGIERALARGRTNIDVGCFQLNYRWHGAAFDTLDQMLSPDDNADYAAQFLRQLYRESGSWRAAAGLYHSRTPHLKARYLARFDTMLAAVPTLKSRPETPPLAGQAGGLRWVSFDDPNRGLLRRATPLFGAAR